MWFLVELEAGLRVHTDELHYPNKQVRSSSVAKSQRSGEQSECSSLIGLFFIFGEFGHFFDVEFIRS